MSTKEIRRDDWVTFLEGFSRRHRGWLVTVEVLGSDIGAQVEANELPLGGVTADLAGGAEDAITLHLGETPEQHVTHTIVAPTRVRLKQTEAGADEALDIESGTGTVLLRFRSAMLPEMVDGV